MPILGEKFNFFTSGNLNRTDTWLDNQRDRDQLDWLGMGISERQDNTLNLNAKINYDFRDNIKMTFSYNDAYKVGQITIGSGICLLIIWQSMGGRLKGIISDKSFFIKINFLQCQHWLYDC